MLIAESWSLAAKEGMAILANIAPANPLALIRTAIVSGTIQASTE